MIDFRDGVSLVSSISLNDLHRYLPFYRCNILLRFVYFFVCSTLSTIFFNKKNYYVYFLSLDFVLNFKSVSNRYIHIESNISIEILSCLYFLGN